MKYIKMLGLAAVAAAALMAFVGAGTASATTLCTATETPCATANQINAVHDNIIKATLSGTAVLERTSGEALASCTVGGMEGKITNGGGSSATVSGDLTALTWGAKGAGCNQTVHTVKLGELEIHHIAGTDNGTVTAKNTEVTVEIFGVSCTYGSGAALHLGTLTGGKSPVLHINAVVNKTAGGFLCPEDARWTATYNVTQPTPIYVEP
ncbi:MAG: hypothetical protein M3335_02115 [Actinomycetota bacterium]|nr:hypothetical protein [Actinomycetota bacterium]